VVANWKGARWHEPEDELSGLDRYRRGGFDDRRVGEQAHHVVVVGIVVGAGKPEGIGGARIGDSREPTEVDEQD
jgi:hypothetical protein